MDDTWSGISSDSDPGDIAMNAFDDWIVCSRADSETAEPDGLLGLIDKQEPDKEPNAPHGCAPVEESVPADGMDVIKPFRKECLTQLPEEIKQLIFKNLNLLDKLDLKVTCRYFYNYMHTYSHEDYLQAEQLKEAKARFFACCYCCRLRPRAKFADNSRVHGKAPGGKKAQNRFCLDCGLVKDEHGHAKLARGTWVTIDKTSWVVCGHCGRLGKTHQGHGTACCEDCWRSHVQPRLEAHAKPVLPDHVEIDRKHHIGDTWVSKYTTPNDVVQSAILIGLSTPNLFSKHRKWDTKGDQMIAEREMDAKISDSALKNRALDFIPRLVNRRNSKSANLRNYRPNVSRATLGPSDLNLENRRSTRATILASKDVVPDFDSLGPNHILDTAAGPGPAMLANQAQPAASLCSSDPSKSSKSKAHKDVPVYAQKARFTCGPACSAKEMKTYAQPQYHIWQDMDMKPACAVKVKLSARSFSTKPAPPACSVLGNSGSIVAGNYLKARQALQNTEKDKRLGCGIPKIVDNSIAPDVVDYHTKAPTNIKTQSTVSRKRRAQDFSHPHSPIRGDSPGPCKREKKRRITEDTDDEWDGSSSPNSPSSPPKIIAKPTPEELRAKDLAKVNSKISELERRVKKRKARCDRVADLEQIASSKKARPRLYGVLDFHFRKKRRLEKKTQDIFEDLNRTRFMTRSIDSTSDLHALRAKAFASLHGKGLKAKKQK